MSLSRAGQHFPTRTPLSAYVVLSPFDRGDFQDRARIEAKSWLQAV